MSRLETAKSVFGQPGMKAMIAFVIVTVALVVALWPRSEEAPKVAPPPSASASGVTDVDVGDAELAAARTEAALAPCPVGTGAQPGVLGGVVVPCMADGSMIDFGAATAGRPLVINMWAVWCLPCRRELPLFEKLSTQTQGRMNVVAVHAREGGEKPFFVLKFLAELGVRLPVVTDPQGSIAQAVGAPRVFPSTIFVRADGSVAAVKPQIYQSYEELADAVKENLGVDVGALG